MALGAAMLMVGKVQFGYIYGIGAVGVIGMWFLESFHILSKVISLVFLRTVMVLEIKMIGNLQKLNLMAPKGAHVGVIASVLGYCILPIVILSVINILIDLKGIIGTVASIAAVLWSVPSKLTP